METLILNKLQNKKQEEHIDLRQYETIPALDEAIAELDRGEFITYNSFEEYLEDMHSDDNDKIHN